MLEQVISNKAGWTRVAFGDVVRKVNDKTDPWESGLERYVAGDHMDTDDLRIRRWGLIGDDYLGPAFHMRFKPGHVLYGSRRTYLRKVALADFSGITANTTYVLEPKDPSVLMPELLPFIMQTEAFHANSIARSKGSVNPYVNFSDIACFEFSLPPIQEQARLVETFRALDASIEALRNLIGRTSDLLGSLATNLLNQHSLAELTDETSAPDAKWRNVCFHEVCERITYGFTNPMPTTTEGPWMVSAKDVKDGAIDYSTARHTSEVAYRYDLSDKSRVRLDDILLTKDGTLGRVALVDRENVCINQSVAVLRPNESVLPRFLARVLRAPQMQFRLLQDMGGSAVKHLYITKVSKTRFFCPEPDLQSEICDQLDCVESQAKAAKARRNQLMDIAKKIQNEALTK